MMIKIGNEQWKDWPAKFCYKNVMIWYNRELLSGEKEGLIQLPSDQALLIDPAFRPFLEKYAAVSIFNSFFFTFTEFCLKIYLALAMNLNVAWGCLFCWLCWSSLEAFRTWVSVPHPNSLYLIYGLFLLEFDTELLFCLDQIRRCWVRDHKKMLVVMFYPVQSTGLLALFLNFLGII